MIQISSTLSSYVHADLRAADEGHCFCHTWGQGTHYGTSPASVAQWESTVDATATPATKEWMEPTGLPELNAEEAFRHLAKVGCLTGAAVYQLPQLQRLVLVISADAKNSCPTLHDTAWYVQILPHQKTFLHTTVVNLFLALQRFVLIPCLAPYLSRNLVEAVTGMQLQPCTTPAAAMDITHKAGVFQSLCDNVQALPQPQQDVLHAIMLVFGPVLHKHHCAPANLIKAWLCTLLCRA